MAHQFASLRPLVFSFLVLAGALLPGSVSAQNRLANGGFDQNLSGWDIILDVVWSPVDARGGNSGSALFSSSSEFGFGELVQVVPVQPGERFRFEASALVEGALPAVAFVGFCATSGCIDGETDEDPILVEGLLFEPAAGFQTQSLITTAPSGTTVGVVVLFPLFDFMSAFNIHFDDVVLAIDNTPQIVVTTSPEALVQTTAGGATTTYTLQNVGAGPSQITLSQEGSFFQQSPATFTLEAGESREVTVTGLPGPAGTQNGRAIPQGAGVPSGLSIPIRALTTQPVTGTPDAAPASNRVDLASGAGAQTGGTASFTNSGSGTVRGLLVSDVDWIIPQAGEIVIPPGATVEVTFTIDPSKRPDGGSIGSATGNLTLVYLDGSAGKRVDSRSSHGSSAASVAVTHTVTPGTSAAAIPPLSPGEVALFMPGVSHVVGSVGTFLSDVTLTSLGGFGGASAQLYFRALGNGSVTTFTSIPSIQPNRPLTFSDIAKGVFGNSTTVGTLQLRAADVDGISAAATVLNASNPSGTYGTSIPVFRSDRSIGVGESMILTGVLNDETNHTNLYLQETSGGTVNVTSEFLAANGSVLGSRTDSVGPFAAMQFTRVVPPGALAARITAGAGSTGRVVSYATPVDKASGDTWAVVDWRRQYAYPANVPVVIPVAGSLRGALSTYFRTDLALTNAGTSPSAGRLRYYSRTGEVIDRNVTLAAGESRIISDVLVTLFNVSGDAVGYLELTPSSGTTLMTSRTYTTVSGSVATFGASVPTLPISSGLRLGDVRLFGGIEDSSIATTRAARPATYRTNLGLVEIAGQPATVRVTLHFSPSPRSAVLATASRTFNLTPNQFLQVNAITREMLGSSRDTRYGDLRNMQLTVEVIGGGGAVVPFTSSIDNGTGDSVFRVD